MATATIDTASMRQGGAGETRFFSGVNGRVVVLEYSTPVANGAVLNIGHGCHFVAWENHTNSTTAASAVFDGVDRVTFETAASPTGRLWCFYKNGTGDSRAGTGGTTQAPDSIAEVGRDLGRLRFVVFSMTAVGNGNTNQLKMTGIRHIMTHQTATSNICSARFTAQNVGTIAWSTSGSNKTVKLIALVAGESGLDS